MMIVRTNRRSVGPLALAATLWLSASPALAHVGVDAHSTFLTGFLHPIGGLDHFVAMVAVGLWAAMAGGQRLWVWPAAFVCAMVAGGILGHSGVELPLVEPMIAGSVVVLGLGIAALVKAPVAIGAIVIAALGIFHGYAHGAEAPDAHWLGYAVGFVLATSLLHAIGIVAGQYLNSGSALIAARVLGSATAVLGVILLV